MSNSPQMPVSRRQMLKTTLAVVGGAISANVSQTLAVENAAPDSGTAPQGLFTPGKASKFPAFTAVSEWDKQGKWAASWIQCPGAPSAPVVVAFRLGFTVAKEASVRLRVSADERYELFLDGKRIGRGSERGNLENWFYEVYDVKLTAGEHRLVAKVWSLGEYASMPQFHVNTEFLLAAEGEYQKVLSTGVAKWECKLINGYSFKPPVYVWGLYAPVTIDGSKYPWRFECGETEGWIAAKNGARAGSKLMEYGIAPKRKLREGTLPQMFEKTWDRGVVRLVAPIDSTDTVQVPVRVSENIQEEAARFQNLLTRKGTVTIPANTTRRILIDLEDYLCAYSELVTSGGAGSVIRVLWAEGLRRKPDMWQFEKGNRNEIEGKFFFGMGNTFHPDGGRERSFQGLWWNCGRYIEVVVKTAKEPVTLEKLVLHETRYPLEMTSKFSASDPEVAGLMPMVVRGMQMCSHETFVDCPYFEQMQYVADARVEALCSYIMTRDERLPRKAMFIVEQSRHACGLTESRYPVREPQFIPWFSLVWIGMIHDYAMWRDDAEFVRSMLPGMRAVLECFLAHIDTRGHLITPDGWNDTDATRESGESALTHWLLVWTLKMAANLERAVGDPEMSQRFLRRSAQVAAVADEVFWNEEKGFYGDTPEQKQYSEIVQSMAILSGAVAKERKQRLHRSLLSGSLKHGTVHGTHYLFLACKELNAPELFLSRLKLWQEMKRNGLKTPIESAEPTRSDCHAWASHPMVHWFTLTLGITPAELGFRSVNIEPQLGGLTEASGRLIHPNGGEIRVNFRKENGELHGRVELPPGLTGTLRLSSGDKTLKAGVFEF